MRCGKGRIGEAATGRRVMLTELIAAIDDRIISVDELLGRLTKAVVFGAGGAGTCAIKVLRRHGIEVLALCDNDEKKHGTSIDGVSVISPASLTHYDGAPVLIASEWGRDIGRQLQVLGVEYYYFGFCVDFDRWKSHYYPKRILEFAEDIEQAYKLLADDESRSVYEAVLRYRLTLDSALLEVAEFPLYGHPKVAPAKGDIILDGGAWIGDTACAFAQRLGGDCTIYSFEPEEENRRRLADTISEHRLESCVFPVPFGMWNKTTTLYFSTSADNSMQYRVDDHGNIKVEVVKIDEFVQKHGLRVDLIKMDIEGAEVEALRGAEGTLRHDRPKLAISAYHRPDDLWRIPLLINEINPDYRFYLGHHLQAPFDIVLYARCA